MKRKRTSAPRVYIISGGIGFLLWVIALAAPDSILGGLITIIPLFSIIWWGSFLSSINVADLYLDEANGTLTVTTMFKEKTLLLRRMEITDYRMLHIENGLALFTNEVTALYYSCGDMFIGVINTCFGSAEQYVGCAFFSYPLYSC